MITKEAVEHVAKLARLGISQKEIKKFQKELSSILDYMEKLKKIDVSKIEPTSHSIKVENVVRKDEAKDYYPPTTRHLPPSHPKLETRKKLVEMAPEKKKGYIKTKSIL